MKPLPIVIGVIIAIAVVILAASSFGIIDIKL